MKQLLQIVLLVVSLGGIVSAQAPSATPTPAPATTKEMQKRIDTLEAQIIALQKSLADKDSALAQLLAENAQFRSESAKTSATSLTRRLITDAGGNPDKDQWDFQTMSLKAATPNPPKP